MAVPKFEQLLLPALTALADGHARRYSELIGNCGDALGLTAEDIAERMSNGRSRLENRIY